MPTREEVTEIINRRITGTDDETLSDIETLMSFVNDSDVEKAVQAKENEWREKYRARFFASESGNGNKKKKTYSDLFKEE